MSKLIDNSYKLFIDGKWVDGKEGKVYQEYNPANGELLATCVEAGKEEVEMAVKTAWGGFENLENKGTPGRGGIVVEKNDLNQ